MLTALVVNSGSVSLATLPFAPSPKVGGVTHRPAGVPRPDAWTSWGG